MYTLLTCWLLWAGLGLNADSVAIPSYPPLGTNGGAVVAELHLSQGTTTEVRVLSGQEPFVSSARSALLRWNLAVSPRRSRALAIVCYRGPGLFDLGSTAQEISHGDRNKSLPYPKTILPPSFPPNSLGEGGVVLKLRVETDGSISEVKTIRPDGSLTAASIEAVREWKFSPARDEQGNKVPSEAFAVFVFRPPVLAPALTPR